VSELPYNQNGRRDYQRILLAVTAAAWGVIVLAGAGWVSSIQAQVNAASTLNASISISLAKLETRLDFLSRDNADLRIKLNEFERTLSSLPRGGGSR
jgi:hypothetical protein